MNEESCTNPKQYNWIYQELVNGSDDVVGAIAYMLYKEHKIELIRDIEKDTGKCVQVINYHLELLASL